MSNWVWYSTEDSRAEGKVSILAIVETLVFVLLTWGVAIYYNFYYYLFIPLILTPFLMLKTPESIGLSHRLFLHNIDVKTHRFFVWSIISIVIGIGIFFIYTFLSELLIRISQKILFLEIFVLTFLFSILYMSFFSVFNTDKYVDKESIDDKPIPIYLAFFFAIFMIPLAFGTLFRSFVVKILSTAYVLVKHPVYTLSYVTSNWHNQVLVNDIFFSPELLPEIGNYRSRLQLFGLINALKNSNVSDRVASSSLIPLWSLAYLYRWSIKSTSWFYWPLSFVLNTKALENRVDQKTLIDDQTNPLTLKGHIIISVILFIYFMGSIVSLDNLGNIESSVKFIDELFHAISVNHPIVKTIIYPETWWLILSATVVYFILYGFSSVQQHRRIHNNPEFSDIFNVFLHWLIRLKNVLWVAFFAINLFFIANQHVWPLIFNSLRSM